MSRLSRIDFPGAIHHVYIHAVSSEALFASDDDRRRFLARLERVCAETGTRLLSWSLMTTHLHLVLQTGVLFTISAVMHRIETGFAMEVNISRDRRGHVFEGRFPSRLIDTELYLETAILYVILNPLRGGLVPDLGALLTYPWTNLPQLIGSAASRSSVEDALRPFGDSPQRLIERLAQVSKDPLRLDDLWASMEQNRGTGVLGDERFAEAARQQAARHRLRLERNRENWKLSDVLGWVSRTTNVPLEDLLSHRRSSRESNARMIVAAVCTSQLGLSQIEIARGLGMTPTSVSRLLVQAGSGTQSIPALPHAPQEPVLIVEQQSKA